MLAREKQRRGDDAPLLERVLRRDEQAWRELVRMHEPALRALIQENEELSASDVDDVIADVWLRVLDNDRRRLRRFAANAAVIARRVARDASVAGRSRVPDEARANDDLDR